MNTFLLNWRALVRIRVGFHIHMFVHVFVAVLLDRAVRGLLSEWWLFLEKALLSLRLRWLLAAPCCIVFLDGPGHFLAILTRFRLQHEVLLRSGIRGLCEHKHHVVEGGHV
jgi:hypothetical protein